MKLVKITGFPDEFEKEIAELPINETSISGRSVVRGMPLIVSMADYPDSPLKAKLKAQGISYLASYPIKASIGILGTFTMGFSHSTEVLERESGFLNLLCHQMGTILENARLYESLNTMASTDPLTGILNRRELMIRVQQEFAHSKRSLAPFAIMMMDIDHFKNINDTFGHDMGDFVLKKSTQVINQALRIEDIFGRYGGEEFIILLRNTDRTQAHEIIERIRKKQSSTKFMIKDKSIFVSASFGGCMFDKKCTSVEELISRADAALYKAKQCGRNRSVLYDELQTSEKNRWTMFDVCKEE